MKFRQTVYHAADFRAVSGVNEGDPVSIAADLVPDDCYELSRRAQATSLLLEPQPGGRLRVAPGCETGAPGASVCLDCTLTLMTRENALMQVVVLVELKNSRSISAVYVAPLKPFLSHLPWRLIAISSGATLPSRPEAESLSFAAGVRVTLAGGRQRDVSLLRPGDSILTRSHGAQHLQSVTRSSVPALGTDAGIRIGTGAFNNPRPLVLGAESFLAVPGTFSDMTPVRHLIDGKSVTVQSGRYIDYYRLEFDKPVTVYAEGLATQIGPKRNLAA